MSAIDDNPTSKNHTISYTTTSALYIHLAQQVHHQQHPFALATAPKTAWSEQNKKEHTVIAEGHGQLIMYIAGQLMYCTILWHIRLLLRVSLDILVHNDSVKLN